MGAARSLRRRLRPVRRRLLILRATHRWRPDRIRLVPTGHVLHVDPADERGWRIVEGLGRGHQPALLALWRAAIEELQPALALDVGVNYGEFLIGTRYPTGCRVVGIEPNPALAPIVDRSVRAHPDRRAITVHQVLASDAQGELTLSIDPLWSGTASAAATVTRDGRPPQERTVPARTLDSLALDPAADGPMVFKIDVEGWEERVLAGMSGLRIRHRPAVGLIEFDPDHLRRAGSDPRTVFELASAGGDVRTVSHRGDIAPARDVPTAATDLLVGTDADVLDRVVARYRGGLV